ncbi:FUSC family protein, partial [Acinetobacter baumannii]
LPIMQIGLAAGLAYFLARDVAGHPRPFFAPISVVIIIGMTGGDRVSKSLDMALGCILGVLVGDLIFYRLGDGGWQIAVIVAGSLLIASFLS